MKDKLNQILYMAIREEQYFLDLYKSGAKKTNIESAQRLFKRLAIEEKSHKEKLLALNIDKISKTFNPKSLDSINLDKELMLTPIDEFKNIKDIFKTAIESEINAKERYQYLQENVKEKEAKELFGLLSNEENKHEKLLKNELNNLDL